jgi:hypothetical protein
MVLETQFVLHLGHIALVALFVLSKFILKTFNFILFLLNVISHSEFKFLLIQLQSPSAFLPLFVYPLLKFFLLNLVERSQLRQSFFRLLLHGLKFSGVLSDL